MGNYKVSCLCNVNVSDKESEVKLTKLFVPCWYLHTVKAVDWARGFPSSDWSKSGFVPAQVTNGM